MSLRLSQLQNMASLKDLGPQSAPHRDSVSPTTRTRKKLEQSGHASIDGRNAPLTNLSGHKSVDGELSISDAMDFNSSVNHKSSSTTFNFDPVKEREEIVNEGSNGVDSRYIKFAMIAFLALLAAAVSLLVCFNVRNAERAQFEEAFQLGAQQIGASFQDNVGGHIQAMESLGIQTTSWASATNSSWPFVTVPDFDLRGLSVRGMAHALSIVMLPLVTEEAKAAYENYTQNHQDWIFNTPEIDDSTEISPLIFRIGEDGPEPETGPGPFFPGWTLSPIIPSVINFNFASQKRFSDEIQEASASEQIIIGKTWRVEDSTETEGLVANTYVPIFDDRIAGSNMVGMFTTTLSWTSVLETAVLASSEDHPLVAVVENECDQQFTFLINSQDASFLGEGDLHDESYDEHRITFKLESLLGTGKEFLTPGSLLTLDSDYCNYIVNVYPSEELEDSFYTNNRIWYAIAISLIFLITASVFFCYDVIMENRKQHILQAAVEARMIVASLFPEQVRGRLFEQQRKVTGKVKGLVSSGIRSLSKRLSPSSKHDVAADSQAEDPEAAPPSHASTGEGGSRRPSLVSQKTLRLKSYLSNSRLDAYTDKKGKPIADLFVDTTVLFGDISGFTKWCSQRDPEQVFFLLESIYGLFDKIARKRGVFKVETIGDCYMAVTGLPDPQEDHSWRMAKFTLDCRTKMVELLKDLEIVLGPDTSELCMRFGMHSGPTTAGVLRGDKSRFQLFGDTVNTASRMESTGEPNRIQLSQATANSLTLLGKEAWLRKRADLVQAKGKGSVQTFWLASRPNKDNKPEQLLSMGDRRKLDFASGGVGISTRMGLGGDLSDSDSMSSTDEFAEDDGLEKRRLSLGASMAQASMMRIGEMSTLFETSGTFEDVPEEKTPNLEDMKARQKTIMWQAELLMRNLRLIVARRIRDAVDVSGLQIEPSVVIDEVVESIEFPQFDVVAVRNANDPDHVTLSRAVVAQVHDYVSSIASFYPDENAFHNFEHASHMSMAASKLLSRVVVPDCNDVDMAADLHTDTYGINSDPLTQFALIFAALIHDVDHPGVPNSRLAQEDPQIAELYKHKSIAEQKSVDIAWEMLMEPKYLELRACIYSSQSELQRFRQVVVNCVMATNIFDPDVKEARDKRWATVRQELSRDSTPANRKATIVLEHVTQVADVAHTMQHWLVFRKFNERLFAERLNAFYDGRSEEDPAEAWYEQELAFFDDYVIPLAMRLGDCEIFGSASNECINYARENREEWASTGREVVEEMLANYTQPMPKRQQRQLPKFNFHESSGSISFEPLKD